MTFIDGLSFACEELDDDAVQSFKEWGYPQELNKKNNELSKNDDYNQPTHLPQEH